jgi:hypothetical protein
MEHEHVYAWDMYSDELCDYWIQTYWFIAIDVLGGVSGIRPSSRQGHPRVEQVGGSHLFLV